MTCPPQKWMFEKRKKIEVVVGIYVIKIPSKYIDLIICSRIFVPFSS